MPSGVVSALTARWSWVSVPCRNSLRVWCSSSLGLGRRAVGRQGDLDIGRDTGVEDALAVGRQPLDDAQPDGRAIGQREHVQHRAGAEGPLADDLRPIVVLEGRRDDLRGARAAVVGEHDDRQVGRDSGEPVVTDRLRLAGPVLLLVDRGALGQEQAGDRDGLLHQPTGIAHAGRASTPVAPWSMASWSAVRTPSAAPCENWDSRMSAILVPGHERPRDLGHLDLRTHDGDLGGRCRHDAGCPG